MDGTQSCANYEDLDARSFADRCSWLQVAQAQRVQAQAQVEEAEAEAEEEREEPDRLAQLLQQSRFDCVGKQSGYYADEELACEVFHYCQDSVKHSWICPDGFTFHQVCNGFLGCNKKVRVTSIDGSPSTL